MIYLHILIPNVHDIQIYMYGYTYALNIHVYLI